MIRQTPYALINLPTLNRAIIVCDEKGNTTYILDTTTHDPHQAIHQTKPQLDQLIQNNPTTATRINYHHKTYLTRITQNLYEPITNKPTKPQPQQTIRDTINNQPQPLQPNERNARELAEHLKEKHETTCGPHLIKKAANELEITSTKRRKVYKGGSAIGLYYTPEQQQRIEDHLLKTEQLAQPPKPGEKTANQIGAIFAEKYNTTCSNQSVSKAAIYLEIPGRNRKPALKLGRYYTPEEQQRIERHLLKTGQLAPKPKPGEKNAQDIANILANEYNTTLSPYFVNQTIKCLAIDGNKHKSKNSVSFHYTPEQQQKIKNHLLQHGKLKPKPPVQNTVLSVDSHRNTRS